MKILIGTPTGDGNTTVQYLLSIRRLEERFRNPVYNIKSDIMFGNSSFMPFSRNALASIVLEDRSYTHLLFVDSDMGFAPDAVLGLIQANKDICGCLYPKRAINYSRFHAISREEADPEKARSIALEYAAAENLQKRHTGSARDIRTTYAIENGLIKTKRLGMGLTLIRRNVFELMAEKLPDIVIQAQDSHYLNMGLRGRVIQCFASVSVNKLSLSEDLSFCHRWTEDCGGEIWARVDQTISHIGPTAFIGRISDRLEHEDRRNTALVTPATGS